MFTRTKLQDRIIDLDGTVTLDWSYQNSGGLAIQVSGAFSGVLVFEVTADDVTYYPLGLYSTSDPTVIVTETTLPGMWWGRIFAAGKVRVRATSFDPSMDPALITLYGQPS